MELKYIILLAVIFILIGFIIWKSCVLRYSSKNPINYPDVLKPEKGIMFDILAQKSPPVRQYINFLNEREGLPLLEYDENVSHTQAYIAYQRLHRYAKEQGWVN